MMQIVKCECGETEMSLDRYCLKCNKYRGASIMDIARKVQEIISDLESLKKHYEYEGKVTAELKSLIDGAYEVVELWHVNDASPSQKEWKRKWLKKAREIAGASGE